MATGIGKGRTITCKFCETTGLRWDKAYLEATQTPHNPNGIMRLWDPATRQVHACEAWKSKLSKRADGLFLVEPNDFNNSNDNNNDVVNAMTEAMELAATKAANSSGITRGEVSSMIAAESLARTTEDSKIRKHIEVNNNVVLGELARLERVVNSARRLEIAPAQGESRIISRQHKLFPELLQYANLRFNIMMVGPAGGGKTTASEKVAEALKLEFYLQPMGPAITESRLLGWIDANGKYVTTMFRQAYEFGGIFMADEIDNCNASALTVLNGALANGQVGFPDKMVKRHPDFVFLGGANTYGRGADRMYVGRQQLDAATLDRFLIINWDYDEDFELYLAGADQKEWVAFIQRVRRIAFASKLRVVVSPRASIDGAKLLRNGIKRDTVEMVRLWSGMPDTEVKTIKSNLR